jgi:peptide/nickel transport system permease protein
MMEGSLQKQLDETEILEEMPFTEWLKMFSANHSAVIGLVILIFVISLSLIGPLFYKTDPFEMVWAPFSPPGEEGFLLGTDYLGRDLLAQIIHGGRASLIVGCAAALLSALIGITLGALAGFYRGWVEEVLMRITEFFQVLPTLLFSMVLVALFGASLPMITFSIGVVSWTAVARITRAEFLKIRELEYVTAARSGGARDFNLIFSVILPNAFPPIVVQTALLVGFAILFEAGLSFLGLSDPNVMSWGAIMGNNRPYILQQGFTIMYPGLAIFITVLSISLVGDGLNDALNPKLRKR